MSPDKRVALNHQISEEAAEWLVEFRTGDIDAAGRHDFDDWVRVSPEHLRAFIEMAALWSESSAIDAQRRLDVDAIIARAQGERNIIGLSSTCSPGESMGPDLFSREGIPPPLATSAAAPASKIDRPAVSGTRLALAASLLVAFLGATFLLGSRLLATPTYATGVGEQRSIRLPDGSRVVLDSRSQLRVDFTPGVRQVDLLQGQALFYVVRDLQKPFLVRAGGAVVRDVGTQFDVNRSPHGTIVTVVEGRVAVVSQPTRTQGGIDPQSSPVSRPPSGGRQDASDEREDYGQPTFLSAGEQVDVLTGDPSLRPARVNVSAVTAWTHGQVVLEAATLRQVAEEFNRYSSRRLVTEDDGITPLRLSGVFVTDPDFLIRYLRERPDIVVTETDSEIDIVRNSGR